MSVRLDLKKITAIAMTTAMSIALMPNILGNDVVLADGAIEDTEDVSEVITTANCTITKPHEGDVMDIVPVSDDPEKYDVKFECWYVCSDPDYPVLDSTDTYKAGKTYAIRVYFKAKDGYEFDDDTKFTINSEYYGKFTPNSPTSLGVETRFLTATDSPYTGCVENGLNWKYYEAGEPVKGWKQIGGIF